MRGAKRDHVKNAIISILAGMVAVLAITWRDVASQICGWWFFAEGSWIILTTYDEILRKRRKSRSKLYRKTAYERADS